MRTGLVGLLTICLTVAACGSDDASDGGHGASVPLEAIYSAVGTTARQNCGGTAPAAKAHWTVDVVLRADGDYDLVLTGPWTPGPFRYTAVHGDSTGRIDHRQGPYRGMAEDSRHTITGSLTAKGLDLVLASEYPKKDGGRCSQSLTLKGPPRPLNDLDGFEGLYLIRTMAFAYGCDTTKRGAPVFDAQTIADLEPYRSNGLGSIGLVDGFHFSLAPEKDGFSTPYNLMTYVFVRQDGWDLQYGGRLTGTVGQGDLDLWLVVFGPDTPSACGVEYEFQGEKFFPQAHDITGPYRLEMTQQGTCNGEEVNESLTVTNTAVAQTDGTVVLYDSGARVVLKLDSASGLYKGQYVRQPSRGLVKYEVRFAPPKMEMSVKVDEKFLSAECRLTGRGTGTKRFVGLPPYGQSGQP